MHQGEIAGFMKALAPVIGEFVLKAMEPLQQRLKALEEREPVKGEKGDPGKDGVVDHGAIEEALLLIVQDKASLFRGEPGPQGEKGEEGPRGIGVTLMEMAPVIAEEVGKAVASIEIPRAPDMATIGLMIGEKVETTVAELPPAKPGEPGKSVTVEDLAPLVVAEVEKAVANMPVKDPVGLAGALIDREGHLVVTLSDGTAKALGRVVGKDGEDVDMDVVRSSIKAEVEALPKPRDGTDGVGFDDLDLVEIEGDLMLRFTRGEVVKEFYLPVPTDRGVWTGRDYRKGASVSWGGQTFIAQRNALAGEKPMVSPPGDPWRMSVKKGRDGASAFDVARKAGFQGSEREWLDSLRPKPVQPVKVG